MAANPVMTYTFTAATPAVAAEVNANLQVLVTWITNNAMQKDGSVAFAAVPSGPATDPTSDNHLARKAYVDSSAASVGDIKMGGWATAPAGWMLCQGQEVSRSTYAALFAAIGTSWGAGNGTTTFNIPDLRGRGPIGAGTGSGLTARTLGANVGTETVLLTAAQSGLVGHNHIQDAHGHVQDAHNHTQNAHNHTQDAHGHAITQTYGAFGLNGAGAARNTVTSSGDTAFTVSNATATNQAQTAVNVAATATNQTTTATNQAVAAAPAAEAHPNMQPSQAVNFAIKF